MVNLFYRLKSKILSSSINKKIFNQGFWILLGNLISKFVLLIATVFMTNYLGKEEYGQFGIIKSTILMFAMFAGMELGMTSTKYIAQYKSVDVKKVERVVGLSNLFAIVISLLVSFLIYWFSEEIAIQINAPRLHSEIRISSFILFFSSLNGVQSGILAGIEKFKELSVNGAIAGVVSSIGLVVSSRYFGLNAVIVAFGFNYVLCCLLNFFTLKKSFYKDFSVTIFSRENFKELDVLWSFSLPAILAGLMVAPVTWLCNYFLVNQPNGYEQMANFDIANQWRNTILFIPSALSQIVLPMLASKVGNKIDYRIVFNKNLKINLYFGVILSLFFCGMSPLIIYIYGDKYNDALVPMIVMFLTTALIATNNVIGQGIASQGKMWLGFFVNTVWAIILLSSSILLIKYFQLGAVGLSIAYLISYIFHTIIQYLYLKKNL